MIFLKFCSVAASVLWLSRNAAADSLSDFKAVLMYFSEPYLRGAEINDVPLEGADSVEMGKRLVEAIAALERENPADDGTVDGKLYKFKRQLAAGVEIYKSIRMADTKNKNSWSKEEDPVLLEQVSVNIQENMVKAISVNEGLILPCGWVRHALALVVKPGSEPDTFNLAFVNTGEGIESHHHSADPNGIYPALSKVWIEFANVPAAKIFTRRAWFVQVLVALKKEYYERKFRLTIAEEGSVFPIYFYGSVLANFKKYEVEPTDDLLVPMQQSGSCTMSSLLGALLYFSGSHVTFDYYKLRIGHAMIESFLDNAKEDLNFQKIIADGFEGVARKFFKGLASSVALQALKYLESALPGEFKHAGLIGNERFNWIFQKRDDAIKALESAENNFILQNIQKSVIVARKIFEFFKHCPVLKSSNQVIIAESSRKTCENARILSSYQGVEYKSFHNKQLFSDFYAFLSGTSDRTDEPIKTFEEFYVTFMALQKPSDDMTYFYKVFNIFKRAHAFAGKSWLRIIEDGSISQLLEILEQCKILANGLSYHKQTTKSFDEIVLIVYLQKLAWKSALEYDKKLPEESRIGLENLKEPTTVQNVIFGLKESEEFNALSGALKTWKVKNIFDPKSLEIFKEILDEEYDTREKFVGPEGFFSQDADELSDDKLEPEIPDSNRELYLKMMEHTRVESKYKELSAKIEWSGIDEQKSKFLIVFYAAAYIMEDIFPQYYNLINTLAFLRLAATESSSYCHDAKKFWVRSEEKDPKKLQLSSNICKFKFDLIGQNIKSLVDSSHDNSFFMARHSMALPPEIDFASFESWFNYVDASETGKLFDSEYFQYISDHVLNIPKFDQNAKKTFPFTAQAADSVINALSRLIGSSLNELAVESSELTDEKRVKMVARAANISVLLTRFIARMECENVLNGTECARALANLYKTVHPFSNLVSSYKLPEPEIGKVHLILAHISSIPLRNSMTFMRNIGLNGPKGTLERFHWFITKRHYRISKVGTNLADDQFNYGNSSNPLVIEETEFLQQILMTQFLPSLVPDPTEFNEFRYHSNGFIVEISNTKNPSENIMFNLWTGALVQNGMCAVNKSAIVNSSEFQIFFNGEDWILASRGTAVEALGMFIYSLPNFKGSSYLVVRSVNNGVQIITFFKKINGFWYQYSEKGLDRLAEELSINHYWIRKESRTFIRKTGLDSSEFLIMKRQSNVPILSFTADSKCIRINVEGMSEGHSWTVVNRKKIPNIQKHIHAFSNGDYILARDDKGRLAIIYLGLRLPDDPERPLVLLENANYDDSNLSANFSSEVSNNGNILSEFKVLNVPNMTVCADQSLNGDRSFSGGLLVSFNDKKMFLLPNVKREKFPCEPNYSFVEKIPVLIDDGNEHGSLAPQSRLHKLLLAYNLSYKYNFDTARPLLHPSKSIIHNEPFSEAEVKVLNWFLGIDSKAPEALALKLFAVIQSKINASLFPNNVSAELALPKGLTSEYLFAIRELSEKYYVFRVFPEILKESFFFKLFDEALKILAPIHISPDSHTYLHKYHFYKPENDEILPIGGRSSVPLFLTILSAKEEDLIDHFSHFIIRRKRTNDPSIKPNTNLKGPIITRENSDPLAWICFAEEPELWSEFKKEFRIYRTLQEAKPPSKYGLIDYSIDDAKHLSGMYDSIIMKCSKKYAELCKGINQSIKITTTSIESLRETMISEAKFFALDFESISASSNEIISNGDITNLKKAEKNIRDLLEDKSATEFSVIKLSSSLQKLFELLASRINEISALQNASAVELVSMICANEQSALIGSILSLMHQRKVKKFESLYACYTKESLACIQRKFPQLNLEQCKELEKKAKVFYARKVLSDYFIMLKSSITNFLKLGIVSSDDLSIFCDELSKISDFNERMENPVILNFEFRSGKYRLKPEQVTDVKLLSEYIPGTNQFKSVVIQRMMAAGKTLVLGTISVVRKALKGDKLSILVPPSSLYQSNTTAMQARTYNYFKKKGKIFTFPRFQDLNKLSGYLNVVLDVIKEEIEAKDYLILSPDALHSFLNSYIETLLKYDPSTEKKKDEPDIKNILKQFAEIYRVFRENGSIILDEIDMTMDPKKELNFPTQDTEPYNMTAVGLLADIMEFLVFDPAVKNSGLKIHSNNQASLTKENYKKCLELILNYIEAQLIDENSLWYKYVIETGSNDPEKMANIMKFLRSENMAERRDWITNLHDSENSIVADALIIVKSQLHQYMEHSLKGTVNQNFGSAGNLRPEIKFAIPYAAANTPSTSSVFADRWETLLKTLLMISATPCSYEIAKEVIQYARDAIPGESAGLQSMETTTTYTNLKLILPEINPLALDHNNSVHVEAVQKALALRSPAAIRILFSYYIVRVFDKMTFPVEQISSNALNVASMFASVQGYSGTIDNVNILPQIVIKDAHTDHVLNEKNNHAISEKLIRDSSDAIVPELPEESFSKSIEEMARDVLNLYPADIIENVSAIIDTGAFFKDFKNSQVAKAFLSVAEGKFDVGLYYDEDSNQLEFVRLCIDGQFTRGFLDTTDPADIKRVTQADVDKRFTYYDQRHITGSDILQPKTGQALMTSGPRVLLRDILQGALRMRQFMTSQKVHFITTASSREFYNSKVGIENKQIQVSDVLNLGSLNEAEKQEHENKKLAFMKIDSEIRAFFLEEISKILVQKTQPEVTPETSDVIIKFVQAAKPLLLRSIREIPLNWLHESNEDKTHKILIRFAFNRLMPIKILLDSLESSSEIRARFRSLGLRIIAMIDPDRAGKCDSLLHYASKMIRTPLGLETGSEVQQQTLTLTLVDVDLSQMVDKCVTFRKQSDPSFKLFDDLILTKNDQSLQDSGKCDDYISIKQLYAELSRHRPDYSSYVKDILLSGGSRIGVTEDLVKFTPSWDENGFGYVIFSNFTFEGSHFLIQLVNNNFKVLLISTKHTRYLLKDIGDFKDPQSRFWICNLSGTVAATNDDTGVGENVLNFIPQIKKMMFDLLIFNGSLPHILKNPELKKLYYETWLASDNFQQRAIFLRLRMKVLLDKGKEIFEDSNGDLGKLKKYSMGDKNPTVSENFVDGYPKGPVNKDFERANRTVEAEEPSQNVMVSETESRRFDLVAEIRVLFCLAPGNAVVSGNEPEFGLLSTPIQGNIDTDLREEEIVKSNSGRPVIFIPDFQDDNIEPEPATSSVAEAVDVDDIDLKVVDSSAINEINDLIKILPDREFSERITLAG